MLAVPRLACILLPYHWRYGSYAEPFFLQGSQFWFHEISAVPWLLAVRFDGAIGCYLALGTTRPNIHT